ncbi:MULTISPECIES: CpaD family pilus assembly protein [Sphingobium]|jgi:pilus assembly protein CpaD|uniref:CpaD family pilus assembly protein n=1 Tax=Sphingobium TaxID=165695 RepID=UPI000DBB5D1F|nr:MULTISPECIES: CpaD family pilus assembly lipoprotein [Sphingobium]KAA9014168.1 pilus assembly protein CpaD [Sphingobium limneticum]BBC99046.1 pilus assembly protein CpaD [Sphingobium sp. YG1]
MTTPLSLKALAAIAMIALPVTAHALPRSNRSVDSIHQPVVSHAAYVFDVQAGSGGGLTPNEAIRLNDWFVSIGLGYGDSIAIVTDSGYYSPALHDDIGDVVARRGLLVAEDSSAEAGQAPTGSVRLIVRRATASVPGCPDWSAKQETNGAMGAGSNFGCGVNSNWAAMVANPEDLVRGQGTDSDLRTVTSNRAISTYRDKAPTGAGDLKQISPGGQ